MDAAADPKFVLGWCYTAVTVLNRLPQIVRNHRRRQTGDLSMSMFLLQILASVLFAAHGLAVQDPTAVVCGTLVALQCMVIAAQIRMYRT